MEKSKTKTIKGSKTTTGSQGDEIIISPKTKDKLDEAAQKTAVFSFGRYNPPTKGHELLVSKLREIARKEKGIPLLFLSHSFDSKKNPIPYSDKIKLAMMAFGKDIVRRSRSNDIISVLKELSRDYDNVVIVAGSDRVPDYKRLEKYNGKDYKFKSFKVVSAGTRDPDGEGVSGMSATKLRDAAKDDKKSTFKKGLASRLATVSDMVFNMVRSGLQLAEELEKEDLLTEVLSIQQRRKRGIMMRRYKTKIARGRKIASKKMANMARLKKRSQRKAIQLVRKRLAGTRGANYGSLSAADKVAIDKRVAQKKAMISKIAKRLMPSVRKGEQQRLARVRTSKNESLSINAQFTNMLFEANFKVDVSGLPTMYMQGTSVTGVKTDLRRLIKKPEENITGIEKVLPADIRKAFRLKMMGKSEEEPIDEKLDKDATMGDYIDDFKKSDAPQFKGKSEKKKREMAIAAFLNKNESNNIDEDNPKLTAVKRKHEREKDQLAIKHARERTRAQVIEMSDEQLLMTIEKMMNEMNRTPFDTLDEKAKTHLQEKSKQVNIDMDTIISNYNEGADSWNEDMNMTQQQAGYAQVNSFIANMKEDVNTNFTNFIKGTNK